MRSTFRSLCLGLLTLSGAAAVAQNSVTVMGSVTPCNGISYPVWIFSDPGTSPAVDTVINTGPNCSYSYTFHPTNASGGIAVLLSCDGGSTWGTSDSAIYNANPIDTLVMNLGCGASSCQAAFTVQQAYNNNQPVPWQMTTTNLSTGSWIEYTWMLPDGSTSNAMNPTFSLNQPGVYGICLTIVADSGNCSSVQCDTLVIDSMGMISNNPVWFDCEGILWGPNVPGTPCSYAFGGQGVWTSDCACVSDTSTTSCQAGFYVIQAYTDSSSNPGGGVEPIPNEVWVWNLSTGGNGDAQYLWNFGDGTSSTDAYPTHEYDGPGPWDLCLTITAGNCTDTYCDSVSVDENGILNGMVIEGHPADQNQRTNGFTLNVLQSEPTGIAETPAIADLRLWPNPAQNELNLTFNNALSGTVSVTVIDPSGRLVISEDHDLTAGPNTLKLNTGSLEPGLYMVRIGNDAHSVNHRFMKVR